MRISNKMIANSMKESARIADTKKSMNVCIENPSIHNFIDMNARNLLRNERFTTSTISHAHGFNYCGIRESLINNDLKE